MCRNPILAEQRRRKRVQLLAATEEKLTPIVSATLRAKEPLRGAGEIGIRVGKVINQHKVAKHFITEITETSFSFQRDREKIATEAELDGLYIVRSNVEPELFGAEQTVRAYKDPGAAAPDCRTRVRPGRSRHRVGWQWPRPGSPVPG